MLDSTNSTAMQRDVDLSIEATKFADAASIIEELRPINRLPKAAIASLAKHAENLNVPAGATVSDLVKDSGYVHYLVEGTLVFLDENDAKAPLNAADPASKTAIDRRINGSADLLAETNCFLARIPWPELENFLLQHAPSELSSSTLEVKDLLSSTSSDWMVRLLQSDLISMLPAANIQEVLASVEVLQLSAEEVVINQGDDPDNFYIVEDGKFSVFRDIKSSGRQIELATLSTGEFFGEEALITGGQRGTSVKASTTSKLLKVNGEQFKKSIVEPTIIRENMEDAQERLNQGGVLVDVRTSEQFAAGHIADSLNLVLQLLRINSNQLDKAKKYLVAADHPNAAAVATFLLRVRGFDATCLNHSIEAFAEKHNIQLISAPSAEVASPPVVEELAKQEDTEETLQKPNAPKTEKPTLAAVTELATKHAARDDTPASPSDYAHTVTGIGLADLIEELHSSDEVEDKALSAATEPATTNLIEVQSQLSEEEAFSIGAADTVETLDIVNDDSSVTSGAEMDRENQTSEVARLVAEETEKLRRTFEKDLQDRIAQNKRVALQALHAHKQKLDMQYRAKQKTLLANSQKLISLANKISQQKAEVEEARKLLALEKRQQ